MLIAIKKCMIPALIIENKNFPYNHKLFLLFIFLTNNIYKLLF